MSRGRPTDPPGSCDTLADRLYDVGFFAVEAFAALEVTAVIVANARIADALGLAEELSSYVVTSYLYPLFATTVVVLVLSGWIRRAAPPTPLFLGGLGVFAAGNLVCASAASAPWFFAGRVVTGVGGALSFAGQLWTLSTYHRWRMTRPLVWGEAGAALGVVAGPLVGALFADASPQGWRGFFLVNASLGLATGAFAFLGLRRRPPAQAPPEAAAPVPAGAAVARVMTAWQVAVSILIVGAEYLFSDYLQAKVGKSPTFVGGMTALASVGAIVGSLWAARREGQLEALPARSTGGLLLALGALAACLATGRFLLAGAPIFVAGACMGLASVSIYASIVRASPPDRFLSRSMVYLLGMQSGNALGVQAVGLAELWHLDVVATAALLSAVPVAIGCAILALAVRRATTTCAAGEP